MELLARGKDNNSDVGSKGSLTVKSCTDEQELHTEAGLVRVRWHVTSKPKILRTTRCVDVAAIGGKLKSLPGEVSRSRDGQIEKSAEVIVGIETSRHHGQGKTGGLTQY